MKQFYTVRDIEDMHAAGVVDIETHDDVVLTDVAREKAIALGMHLNPVEPTNDGHQGPGLPRMAVATGTANPPPGAGLNPTAAPSGPPAGSQATIGAAPTERVMKIKTAVVARLGTDKYNELLDKIIPQVMSQFKK
ncbi:hypothetical protein [Desulfosarcina sp.]|uniref:hypothetical protein n=1 Tax=Desulfosarcina sp. TaxID=2027861 RepID=UPI00299FDBB0|nr:hypothetical protein [Desulfosarcina sp.]MDX2452991.1 hypothetical protein [Desulfosarcina sp.]MDX2490726.1 hypothetical protein [Desulfosarcina sp.]